MTPATFTGEASEAMHRHMRALRLADYLVCDEAANALASGTE